MTVGDIFVGLIILAIIATIIRNMIKRRKGGGSALCSSCPSSENCPKHAVASCSCSIDTEELLREVEQREREERHQEECNCQFYS